MLNLSAMSHLH